MNRTTGLSRQHIIDALSKGAITDKSGRATSVLLEKANYQGSLTGLTALLKAMETGGLIQREVKGKRCFSISLTKSLQEQQAQQAQPERPAQPAQPAPAVETSSPATPPEASLDAAAIASALLDRVIEIAGKPQRDSAEFERLKADYQQMQQRLYDATQTAERLRQKMRIAEDELIARKVEVDGLRQRLRETESNLDKVIHSNSKVRLDFERERELKDLISMMRAPISTKNS